MAALDDRVLNVGRKGNEGEIPLQVFDAAQERGFSPLLVRLPGGTSASDIPPEQIRTSWPSARR